MPSDKVSSGSKTACKQANQDRVCHTCLQKLAKCQVGTQGDTIRLAGSLENAPQPSSAAAQWDNTCRPRAAVPATDAGDPSPFKAFPARAVQLDTSDNYTFSRRHGTETGRLHSVHNGPTVMGGRLVNPRVCHRDLFRSRPRHRCTPPLPAPLLLVCITACTSLCLLDCCPSLNDVKWRTPYRCDTQLPYERIRPRSTYRTMVHMRCTIRAGIARIQRIFERHKQGRHSKADCRL